MKNINLKSYVAGVVTMLAIVTLTIGGFAATKAMTISVNSDIKLKISGEDFVPKDAAGKPVFVFEYDGTTYVPIRAISEKLGYKIGYDNDTRTAMIGKTNEEVGVKPVIPEIKPVDPNHIPTITLDEMKAMFKSDGTRQIGGRNCYYHKYNGKLTGEELVKYWNSLDKNDIEIAMQEWILEISKTAKDLDKTDISLRLDFEMNNNSETASYIAYGLEKQFYEFWLYGMSIF